MLTLFFTAFPGILKWQHRIWLCLTEFNQMRQDKSILSSQNDEYTVAEKCLFESGNRFICLATHNFKCSHFSVAIKNLQELATQLRVRKVLK